MWDPGSKRRPSLLGVGQPRRTTPLLIAISCMANLKKDHGPPTHNRLLRLSQTHTCTQTHTLTCRCRLIQLHSLTHSQGKLAHSNTDTQTIVHKPTEGACTFCYNSSPSPPSPHSLSLDRSLSHTHTHTYRHTHTDWVRVCQ